jgi:RNA polymerase sigma factor (TIGR02999 family)
MTGKENGTGSDKIERVTEMLERLKESPDTLNRLMDRIYEDIRRIAHFEQQSMDVPKIQTTVLVHEVYLKMFGREIPEIHDESHLKRLAAQTVRYLIVDRVRTFMAQKRGAGAHHTGLDKANAGALEREDLESVVAVENAIQKLEETDARLAEIVVGTYYGGFSAFELSEMTGLSRRTIQRDLKRARGWLKLELDPPGQSGGSSSMG